MAERFRLVVQNNLWVYMCPKHEVEMTEEMAKLRNVMDFWSGGKYRPVVAAEVLLRKDKRYVQREKRRPKVEFFTIMMVRCPSCQHYEEHEVYGVKS